LTRRVSSSPRMWSRLREHRQIKFLLIFVVPMGTGAFSTKERTPGPLMVTEENPFDFMEVIVKKVMEHTFEVRNEGDQDLEMKNVRPR